MQTPPTHYYLESSGYATYMKTHPYTPNIMCKNYYSSQEYSQETLFIPILLLGHTIKNHTTIENTNAIHNILTIQIDTSHPLEHLHPWAKRQALEMRFEGIQECTNFFRVALPHCYLHTGSSSRKIIKNIP